MAPTGTSGMGGSGGRKGNTLGLTLGRSALSGRRFGSLLIRLVFALIPILFTRQYPKGRRSVIGRRPVRGRTWSRRKPFREKVVLLSILSCRWTLKSWSELLRTKKAWIWSSRSAVIAACVLPPKRESAVREAVLSEFTPGSNRNCLGREERMGSLRILSISDIEDVALCDKTCIVRER
ncbi:hypothetical protein DPMN_136530 [Dreissena polymorpha]|uniref:Uncharacterized protein n=1 Tax=Dreissena polymorpha TaxID=45954 RepID=A0A9D4FZZ0_DREPO|nr:hypothetical protein DPMN_136530 [Dreissena polymorpha]